MTPPLESRLWAVVLGYNHPEDTIECLQSLKQSDDPNLCILYVDNGSEPEACDQVVQAVDGIEVIRLEPNAGVAGGLNAGIRYACQNGADDVVILNNDTTVDLQAMRLLAEAAQTDRTIGMVIPKIYYYDHPDTIWSAGSVHKTFPPVITMRKTRQPESGEFGQAEDVDFSTFCVILLTREMLSRTGLLDPDYHFLFEDYDLCLRARDAGFRLRYLPAATVKHKISKTTGAGTNKPAFWHTNGRSEAIFRRKFRHHRLLTGYLHIVYIILRFLYEGHSYGLKPFLQGWRKGLADPISPPPRLQDSDACEVRVLHSTRSGD